jgi:eukaryotic-like serine/threonine-protein kinase
MNGSDFWGRKAEIERIHKTLADVAAGNGKIILYDGEAGIGKTRLIAEVSSIAIAQDFRVINGRCFDEEGVPAFWPWIEILRGIGRLSGWDEVEQIFRDDRDFLQSILPELKNIDDELSDTDARSIHGGSGSTFVKAYNFYRIIESAASGSPMVIALNDIQWADEQSLAVLRVVARNIDSVKVLLILAYRTETAANDEGSAKLQASYIDRSVFGNTR